MPPLVPLLQDHGRSTLPAPTPNTDRSVPVLGNLAVSAEMSASLARSGPTPAGYVGTKHQAVTVPEVSKSPLCASLLPTPE